MSSRTERKLLNELQDLGYTGLKVDPSTAAGYHVDHPGGDLIVGRRVLPSEPSAMPTDLSDLYVIEEKYTASTEDKWIRVKTEKTREMVEFAERLGATPVLAARWSTRTEWSPGAAHFCADVRETDINFDAKTFGVKPADVAEDFEEAEVFFG